MRRECLLPILLASVSLSGQTPPKTRLSEIESIGPESYRVDLTLNPESNIFSGEVAIRMDIPKPLRTIWLNQEKIQIQSAVLAAGGKNLKARIMPGGDDFVGLDFDEPVSGRAVATIKYTGVVQERNSSGIFREQETGNWYIYSQFEATDARAAFP
jgi:alanyl aminopeptidase